MDLYSLIQGLIVWVIEGLNGLIIGPLTDLLASLLSTVDEFIEGFFLFIGWETDFAAKMEFLPEFIRDLPEFLLTDVILDILTLMIAIVIFLVVVMGQVILFLYLERKILARITDRHSVKYVGLMNHGFLQQIADALKLFQKEIITPDKSDKMLYHVAPVILVSSTLMILAALPLSEGFFVSNLPGGILYIMAMFSVAPIAILVGGWASNNKYTLIGGMRSAAMMMSYEIPLLLAIASVVILAGTFNLIEIVDAQGALGFWYALPLFIGFIIYMISIIAEVERIPFDLPEAEAELVEGWTTEYGGMRLALIFLIEYVRLYAGAVIAAILFLGGWAGPTIPVPLISEISGEIWITIKIYVIILLFIWIRWSLPRVRTDQILHFGWRRLLPLSVLNVFIAIVFRIVAEQVGWM